MNSHDGAALQRSLSYEPADLLTEWSHGLAFATLSTNTCGPRVCLYPVAVAQAAYFRGHRARLSGVQDKHCPSREYTR